MLLLWGGDKISCFKRGCPTKVWRRTRQSRKVLWVGLADGCLTEAKGLSSWQKEKNEKKKRKKEITIEGKSTSTRIYPFPFWNIQTFPFWNTVKELQTFITHNTNPHNRVRFYACVDNLCRVYSDWAPLTLFNIKCQLKLMNKNGSIRNHQTWRSSDQCEIWYNFMKFLLVCYTGLQIFDEKC